MPLGYSNLQQSFELQIFMAVRINLLALVMMNIFFKITIFLGKIRQQCFIIGQGMSKSLGSYLAAIFGLSILSVIAAIATVSMVFALNYSGYNFTTIAVSCGAQPYLTLKWTFLYLPLRAQTSTGLIYLCLTAAVLVLAIKLYWPVRELTGEALEGIKIDKKMVAALYILVSCELLCTISNAGGKLSLVVDNKSCTILGKQNLISLMVVSLIAFLTVLTQWLLVVALDCQGEDGQQEPITLRDVHGNEVAREEDAMSKHLEMQMKEYFSNNINQKEGMMEGLLKREDQTYGGIYANPQMGELLPTDQKPQDQAYQYQQTGKYGNNKRKTASLMHSYNGMNEPQNGDGYYANNELIEQQQDEENNPKQDQNGEFLYAKFDDNLSEKFDQNNFEIDCELQRAMKKDKQEDLSPLQLKQLMNLTKAAFVLKDSKYKGLQLQKAYEIPEGFKININFVKIKDHKETLQNQIQKLIDEPNPSELTQTQQKNQEKKVKEDLQQKPVTEQTSKLLKVVLFNHSEFHKKREEKQTQCPISKYVEHDDGFEIIQSNQKADKHKRFEYSKEQLLFSKKRKDNDDGWKDKGTLRQEFNEGDYIKMERKALFGENWINQHDRKQGVVQSNRRPNKRSLVEVIRSKYYE